MGYDIPSDHHSADLRQVGFGGSGAMLGRVVPEDPINRLEEILIKQREQLSQMTERLGYRIDRLIGCATEVTGLQGLNAAEPERGDIAGLIDQISRAIGRLERQIERLG